MFTLSQLESFVAVAEELHYGRAATRLSMTQPPLSRRIQQLESEIGVELFDRGGRSVRLTAAGRAFLGDARRILAAAQHAALSVRRVPDGEVGSVALGFTAGAAYAFLDGVVAAVRTELPQVDVVLHEMVSGAQIEALRSGRLDLALVRPPIAGPELRSMLLLQESLLVALPADHPLARAWEPPHLRDLDGQPFVMYSPAESRYFHEIVIAAFRTARVAPHYVQHLSQIHTVLALVRSGLGAALVPAAAASLHLDGVMLRPIGGVETLPVELYAAWRIDHDNPTADAVLRVLRGLDES